MKNIITQKGLIGSVWFSEEDMVFHGKIEGINDLVSYEGSTVEELITNFHEAVDDYLELCKEVGKEPGKSYKGSFNVRINPDLHKKAAMKAKIMGVSLNQFVLMAIEKELSD
ncbi:MAG: type II toxin-antitoxin system HicB family antitoxin [Nitrospirae bacterium]|nr:type II toxin-antitoxin system HicB family antitoxin [Nitrospirota bacterium]